MKQKSGIQIQLANVEFYYEFKCKAPLIVAKTVPSMDEIL